MSKYFKTRTTDNMFLKIIDNQYTLIVTNYKDNITNNYSIVLHKNNIYYQLNSNKFYLNQWTEISKEEFIEAQNKISKILLELAN